MLRDADMQRCSALKRIARSALVFDEPNGGAAFTRRVSCVSTTSDRACTCLVADRRRRRKKKRTEEAADGVSDAADGVIGKTQIGTVNNVPTTTFTGK